MSSSSAAAQAPGTLYRLTTADGSKHCTAVVLKNGRIHEVKNEITANREDFDSLDAWQQARGADLVLTADSSKAVGVVIREPPSSKGFDCPTEAEKHIIFNWPKWLYSILYELAPHLLENETLKGAYNTLVATLRTHKDKFGMFGLYNTHMYRYNPMNIGWSDKADWKGYRIYYRTSYHTSYYNTSQELKNTKDTIVASYKTIVEIVRPVVSEQMEKKFKFYMMKRDIVLTKMAIRRKEKKIRKFEDELEAYKVSLADSEKRLAELAEA